MMKIPELDDLDVAFGKANHMPKYDSLPVEFQRQTHPACEAVSTWFFAGAASVEGAIVIDGTKWTPREGVDFMKALRAIRALLRSWEPKHEHKIAGCGFMLNEWFSAEKTE